MKNLYFILFILLSAPFGGISQGQFGITAGIKTPILNTNDFIDAKGNIGWALGVSALSPLYEKADWLIELSYETATFSTSGYLDFDKDSVFPESDDGKVKSSSLDLRALVNQYIIVPEAASFHIGVQGGIGLAMLSEWQNDSYPIFDSSNFFRSYYLVGLSGGSETYRINLQYRGFLGNALKGIKADDNPNRFGLFESREFDGSESQIVISFTYYFQFFNN